MNAPFDVIDPSAMKFAVGQPVPRKEDPTLLQGRGRYSDDINLPGQAYGVIVRSRVAHGRIVAINVDEALALPGVLAIYTGSDLTAGGIGLMPKGMSAKNRDGSEMNKPDQPVLTQDKVRFVGDPVALVVAGALTRVRPGTLVGVDGDDPAMRDT